MFVPNSEIHWRNFIVIDITADTFELRDFFSSFHSIKFGK